MEVLYLHVHMETIVLQASAPSCDVQYLLDIEWDVRVYDIKRIPSGYEIKVIPNPQSERLLSFSEIYGQREIWKLKRR